MKLPDCLHQQGKDVCLAVKLQPRASKNTIAGVLGQELKITVTAPPVDSAANAALIRFLAKTLDCPRGAVELARGQTSRHKQVRVRGVTAEELAAKLGLVASP